MSDSIRGNIRVSIDSSFHDLYKALAEGSDPEKAPFRTMKDVFMLAACLGYRRGQRQTISGRRTQIFHWTQFSEQVDVPILKAIAIATTHDILVLSDPEKIVQVAEEFANAGFQEISTQISSGLNQPLWNAVDIIRA